MASNNFIKKYGEGSKLVKYGKTVGVQDTTGKILNVYSKPEEVASEYGGDWQANLSEGGKITNEIVRRAPNAQGVASYGFQYGDGNSFLFPDEKSAFQAYGKSNWNDVNKGVTNVSMNDKEGLGIAQENLVRNLDNTRDELTDYLTTGYDKEYNKLGLGEVKTSISTLDAQIAEQTRIRDEAIAKVNQNPGMSASSITGDVSAITSQANDTINNLISQRNAMATQYNQSLDELSTKMGLQVQGKQSAIEGTESKLGVVSGQLQSMSDAEIASMQAQLDQERWEREFALDAFNADTSRMSATKRSSSSTSSTPKYTVTTPSGQTVQVTASQLLDYETNQAKKDEEDAKIKVEEDHNLALQNLDLDIEMASNSYKGFGGAGLKYDADQIFFSLKSAYPELTEKEIRDKMEDAGII